VVPIPIVITVIRPIWVIPIVITIVIWIIIKRSWIPPVVIV
jgi:hypothetical protein